MNKELFNLIFHAYPTRYGGTIRMIEARGVSMAFHILTRENKYTMSFLALATSSSSKHCLHYVKI